MPGVAVAWMLALSLALPSTAFAGGSLKLAGDSVATAGNPIQLTVTVADKKGKRNKDFRGTVSVTTDDPQGVSPPPHKFAKQDKGRFTFTGLELRTAGSHHVTARAGKLSASKDVPVTPGALDEVTVSPATSNLSPPAPTGAGADYTPLGSPQTSQAYAVAARDAFGNSLGDVTSSAAFSIAPDGSCAAAVCSPAAPGEHTVTATTAGASDTAAMSVATVASTYTMACQGGHFDVNGALADGCEAVLDHLTVSPSNAAVSPPAPTGVFADFTPIGTPQSSQSFTVSGADAANNPLGDFTSSATWSISPDGSCAGAVCSPASAGPHTVTANVNGVTATAPLNVATLAATYTMTCQGEHWDIDQGLANGCEQTEAITGNHRQYSTYNLGNTDDCDDDDHRLTRASSIFTDSRVHTNPTVAGFDSVAGGASDWYQANMSDSSFCVEHYELTLTATGGALNPSDCYKVTVSWVFTGSDASGSGSESAVFSGTDSVFLDGDLAATHTMFGSNDDSATVKIRVEPICAPPRNERVDYTIDLHF
jgi:hypothetical protein